MNLCCLYIQKLTVKRIINYSLLRLEYVLSFIAKKPYLHTKPFAASIEPANYCNLRCPECPTGRLEIDKKGLNLSFAAFQKMINPLLPELFYLNLYFQGEPFLNKELTEMIAYAHKKNIITNISTNGHFLSEEIIDKIISSHLDRIIISVDGTTAETYEQYRVGGKFDTVIEGIERLVQRKKERKSSTPFIELQFIVFSTNEHEISSIKRIAKETGVDAIKLKTAQLYDYKHGNPLMPTIDKYNRYRKMADGTFIRKKAVRNSCWKSWSSVVVSTEGDVLPCCFDKHKEYTYGNLFEQGFGSIWNGNKATAFRTQVLKNRKCIGMCTNCTE